MRLGMADELLDIRKSERLRQCIDFTKRMAALPGRASRKFFVGRWHVIRGARHSTDMDWRADGTCKHRGIFFGTAYVRNLKDDDCTWEYEQLGDGEFAIDWRSEKLGPNWPKRLRFEIVNRTRIHNIDMNYDAFRMFCPDDELDIYSGSAGRRSNPAEAAGDEQAETAPSLPVQQLWEAEMRLAMADELLDLSKRERLRQCIDFTKREAALPAGRASREFFVGRWHVIQGPNISTDMDWFADGTCERKTFFPGSAHALDLKNDVCTWDYEQLGGGEFAIRVTSEKLGPGYPKRLRFKIVNRTRIHNVDMNYDAFRMFCPGDE